MDKPTFREACIKAYDVLWSCYAEKNTTEKEEKALIKLLKLLEGVIV